MASGPITSWHINGETVADFILGAPKSLQMVTAAMKLQVFKLDLEKAEEPEIKLPHLLDHEKNKRVPEKHLLLPYLLCQSL